MRTPLLALALALQTQILGAEDISWREEFLSRLDPAGKAGAVLAELPSTADPDSQIHAVARAMRGREIVEPLWVIPFPDEVALPGDISKAEDAVAHLIHSQYGSEQFGDTLPWFSPTKQVQTLARFPHFDWLAPAYSRTGDERYARAMVRDMRDFVAHVPIERASWVTPQTDPVINPWNWVLQHWRIMRWIDALAYLRDSPSLPDSTYCRLTLHIWKEVEWLLPRMQLGLHNSTLGNIRAVLYAGIRLPDARSSSDWMARASGMFRFFLDSYFYPGEVSIELTLGYSSAVLGQCLKIYRDLPDSEARRALEGPLQALVEGHLGLMKPDRSLPRYGDHGDYDFTKSVLAQAAELFDRGDWREILEGTDGTPDWLSYPKSSMPYYLSGYYAMRDGWDRTAQYLSMDAGAFGTNHQHGDKLSITVSADGADFIVDPGTAIYRTTRDVRLPDLRPGFLHNTITVDGIDPSAGYDQHYQFDVMENRWITARQYDFLDGVYDYRTGDREAMARRSVLYLRGEYWIILDAVYGRGTARIESNLQFAPGVDLTLQGTGAVARSHGGAMLHLATVTDPMAARIIRADTVFPGTTFPFRYGKNLAWNTGGRGWVGMFGNHSADMHAVETAPALLFSGKTALPHFSLMVISPSRDHRPRPLGLDQTRMGPDRIAARIIHQAPEVIDHFQWQPTRMPEIYSRPEQEGGCWMRERQGSLERIILIHTPSVEFADGDLSVRVRLSDRADLCAQRDRRGWTVAVDPVSPAGLRLVSFEVRDRGGALQKFAAADTLDGLGAGEERRLVPVP